MNTPPTILNVEDIDQNRVLVRRILENEGYRVVDAVSAIDGIEKAKSIEPDLILMDINLPDLDGFTAVTRIRSYSQLQPTPIIAVTARNVSNDRERAIAIGCDSYINKPIDIDELIEEVARHLAIGHKENGVTTEREAFLREHNVVLSEQLQQKLTELQAAYHRLKQLEEAKSSFIAVASHELRTPLTVIHSYTQMLKILPAIKEDPTAKELFDGMTKGIDRLQDIINDMVSVVRVELSQVDLELLPVSIRTIIRAIERKHTETCAERNITLTAQVAEDLTMVNGDGVQIESAIDRIVGNAIKYTPDHGQVTITAQMLHKRAKQQPFVEIIVADTGVGISLDKQKEIFKKFSTAANVALHSSSKTKFMGSGAGLGLPIAKGIIESHSGRVWVESDGYDRHKLPGSKFFILLPAL